MLSARVRVPLLAFLLAACSPASDQHVDRDQRAAGESHSAGVYVGQSIMQLSAFSRGLEGYRSGGAELYIRTASVGSR